MPQKCHILPNNPKLFNPDNYAQMNNLMHGNVDPTRPRVFLNYVLFDKNRQVVGSFTGAWQVNGEGTWQPMGTGNSSMTIPVKGYLAVYISNASTQADGGNSDVWFGHISIKISKGHLREEQHYYPYGLPMSGIGASDLRQNPNRRRYQSNEYIKALGLNWMSFGARQYDPQLGRFMSVDPLAAAGGQEMMSPYAAMGDEPVSQKDPTGTTFFNPSIYRNKVNLSRPFCTVCTFTSPALKALVPLQIYGHYGAFFDYSADQSERDFIIWQIEEGIKEQTGGGNGQKSSGGNTSTPSLAYFYNEGMAWRHPPGCPTCKWTDNKELSEFKKKYYSSQYPKRPIGTMTLSEANRWVHYGNGMGVYIDFKTITLPKSVTVERFNKSDLSYQGYPLIYVHFDYNSKSGFSDYVNINQAWVYGSIGLVLIDKNTVWAIPDSYDFKLHNTPGSFWRNTATTMGAMFSQFQYGFGGAPLTPFPIYFIGTQKIPDK